LKGGTVTNPVTIVINAKNTEVELDTARMVQFYKRWNIDLQLDNDTGVLPLERGRPLQKVCTRCQTLKLKTEFRQITQVLQNGKTRQGQRMRVCITCENAETKVCATCNVEKPVVEFRRQTKDKPRKNCHDCQRSGNGVAGPKGHVDRTRKPCHQCYDLVRLDDFPVSPKGRRLWVCQPCLAKLQVEKVCRICKVTKPADDFERHTTASGGRRHECRDCTNVRRKTARAKR